MSTAENAIFSMSRQERKRILADSEEARTVSLEEANTYMNLVRDNAPKFALAIPTLVLSPIPMLLLGALAEMYPEKYSEDVFGGIGLAILLIIVLIAIVPIILSCMRLSKYDYLEKEEITLLYGVRGVVEKKKEEYEETYRQAL